MCKKYLLKFYFAYQRFNYLNFYTPRMNPVRNSRIIFIVYSMGYLLKFYFGYQRFNYLNF
jgi:hypothetical protein